MGVLVPFERAWLSEQESMACLNVRRQQRPFPPLAQSATKNLCPSTPTALMYLDRHHAPMPDDLAAPHITSRHYQAESHRPKVHIFQGMVHKKWSMVYPEEGVFFLKLLIFPTISQTKWLAYSLLSP